ncbi:MAG: helix-turn-helix domain-containing protein [Bacillota bacterium]
MRKSKYFRRLIAFSMLLVTIPVVLLGSLSYYKSRGIIQEKVNEGNSQVLLQTQLNVEQVLQTIDTSLIQFMNSPLLNQSIHAGLTAKNFRQINDLNEALHKLQTYDAGVQDVRLASFAAGWYMDNNGFRATPSTEIMRALTELAGQTDISKWITDEASSSVLLVKKLPINTMNNPAGVIVAKLPDSRLQKLVSEHARESQTVILDKQYRLLTKVDNPSFPPDMVTKLIGSLKEEPSATGFKTVQIDGNPIGLTYRVSPYNEWIYVSIVSIGQITQDSRAIGWYTLYVCLAVFFVLLILSLLGSRKMYLPIRRVFDAAISGEAADRPGSSDDELEQIGERIISLRTSQSRLLEQIQGQTRQLKEFFVRKLLIGELGMKEIQDKAELFQYKVGPGGFCTLAVQVDTLTGTRFREKDRDLLMFAVNNIVSELVPAESRFDPVVLGENQVTLLKNAADSPDDGKNDAYAWAETIQANIKSILELRVSIGISHYHPALNAGAQAYRESLEALKYRIRFGEGAILHVADVLPDHQVHTPFPEWIEKQMIDALMIPDLDKARLLLREFLTMTVRENIRHQEYQMILFRLLADLIREFQNTGERLQVSSGDKRQLFEQLADQKTISETEQWFMMTIMEPMVSLMSQKWDTRNKNISEQIKDIIHTEFETDLTLEVCGTRLSYHPNYLKTVFRKETGVNFSDYLSQYRLGQAKKWLLETDMKISEIAEKLRYQNPQNFIRYFRKMEEMTPGEYRKKYRSA